MARTLNRTSAEGVRIFEEVGENPNATDRRGIAQLFTEPNDSPSQLPDSSSRLFSMRLRVPCQPCGLLSPESPSPIFTRIPETSPIFRSLLLTLVVVVALALGLVGSGSSPLAEAQDPKLPATIGSIERKDP